MRVIYGRPGRPHVDPVRVHPLAHVLVGAIPAVIAMAVLSSRRRLMMGVLIVAAVASPMVLALFPDTGDEARPLHFEPERGQPTVRVGAVGLDPSTSARLISVKQAFEGWCPASHLRLRRDGFAFMDHQFARTLVETGIVGLATSLAADLGAPPKAGVTSFRTLQEPEDRGLALGFMAGTIGLLGHAIGSNTFIIVRIMEPFWFFAGSWSRCPVWLGTETALPPARAPACPRRAA